MPPGNVTVTVNQVSLSAPIDATGHFSVAFPTATLPDSATPYTITYAYAGSPGFSPASDTSQSLTVTPAPLVIVVDSKSKAYGQPNPTLTGTVSGILNNDDVTVEYTTTATQFSEVRPGGYPITVAGLSGAAAGNYSLTVAGASVTGGTLTITPAQTTLAVASPFSPALAGQALSFTATVSAVAPGGGVPAGSVQFLVDGGNLGSPVPLAAGQASSPSTVLGVGSHLVGAVYLPAGGNYLGSSAALTQKVRPVTAANLQGVIAQALASGAPLVFWVEPARPGKLEALLEAIDHLQPPPAPITLTVDLRGGRYPEHAFTAPSNVKVVFVNGTRGRPRHGDADQPCPYRSYLEGLHDRLARL